MESSKTDCSEYKPGTKQGKNGPVCAYYERYMNGVCTHPKHFQCDLWIERWMKEHPVENTTGHPLQK